MIEIEKLQLEENQDVIFEGETSDWREKSMNVCIRNWNVLLDSSKQLNISYCYRSQRLIMPQAIYSSLPPTIKYKRAFIYSPHWDSCFVFFFESFPKIEALITDAMRSSFQQAIKLFSWLLFWLIQS